MKDNLILMKKRARQVDGSELAKAGHPRNRCVAIPTSSAAENIHILSRLEAVAPANPIDDCNAAIPPVEHIEAAPTVPKRKVSRRKLAIAPANSTKDCNPPVPSVEDAEATPAAPKRKVGRPKLARQKKIPCLHTFELSITVSIKGQDIDKALISNVNAFILENTLAGKCSLERGGVAFHLHLQMVIRIQSSSVIAVSKKLKTYLGWDKNQLPGRMVMCRKLTNKGLHTFISMIGYCMKDSDQPHFETIDHNVSAADIALGFEQYSLYGKEENKNRVVLTMNNFVDRVFQWRKFNCKHPMVVDFARDLYDMMKTGKYYPSPAWVVGGSGRGYEPYRMQSLYRMMVCPADISRVDISNVFEIPEMYRRLEVPTKQWFDDKFRDDAFKPPLTAVPVKRTLFANLEHSRWVEDSENYKLNTFVDKDTSDVLAPKEESNVRPLCAAALETPDKTENRNDRKGKKKVQDSRTRHLWPPEWSMDRIFSTTDSSCGSARDFVPALPGDIYIPLYTR